MYNSKSIFKIQKEKFIKKNDKNYIYFIKKKSFY
jgi:hypothetical protein